MSFRKYKSDSFRVGGDTDQLKNIYGDITSKVSKVVIGYCSISKRKKSFTVSDNTIQAEGLVSYLKSFRRISAKAGEKRQLT